ncbi:MAG: sensor histidine kinase [Methylococcaceae bacterium]|nr:sensor histidine kinase [Methylococcaceae bacterium]
MPNHDRFLPDFCAVRSTFVLVLLAEMLALLLALASAGAASELWTTLGLLSLFILWIILGSAATLCISQRWWRGWSVARSGFLVLAVTQVMNHLAVYIARTPLLHPFDSGDGYTHLRTGLSTALLTGLWLRFQFVQHEKRRQSRAEAQARLDSLQARMRPHFLFNSLNAIAGLTRLDPRKAEELLLDLAELFRAILKKDQPLYPLREEIQLARQYLNIEQQRLGHRLQIQWAIASESEGYLVPPLSLQPLLENAVYHGIEPSESGGTIDITARLRHDRLLITVTNPVPDRAGNGFRSRPGNRLALENLRLRLDSCYAGEARLLTSQVDDRYQVRLVLPLLAETP